MDLVVDDLMQQFVSFVADDGCATLVDEQDLTCVTVTAASELGGDGIQ